MVRVFSFLEHGHIVSNAISLLQEHGASEADKAPSCHDADAVTEDVSLVHVVSGQQNYAILLVFSEGCPSLPPRR